MRNSLVDSLITDFCHQNSHEWFTHFCAHFGMSFTLVIVVFAWTRNAAASLLSAVLVGFVYKYFEGPLWYPGFAQAMATNLLGSISGLIALAYILRRN